MQAYRLITQGKMTGFSYEGFVANCGLVGRDFLVCDKVSRYEREREIELHLEMGDYFGTLATVVDLLLQTENAVDGAARKMLENIRDDLLFLEKHYTVNKKIRNNTDS